jgi:hypothetical protein
MQIHANLDKVEKSFLGWRDYLLSVLLYHLVKELRKFVGEAWLKNGILGW